MSKAWVARAGALVLGIVVLRLAFELWWVGRIHEHLWVQAGVAAMYVLGVLFMFLSAMDIDHAKLDRLGFVTLVTTLAFYTLVTIKVAAIHYTSDALLFVHQAALVLLEGQNPYTAELLGAQGAFQVPYYVQTPTTTGGAVSNLNYPALSFLTFLPVVTLGLTDLRPVSVGFLLGLLGLLFWQAPRHLRLLVLSMLFMSSFFLAFTLSGFDIVFIFYTLATIVFWKRSKPLAMVMFGLAMSIKTTVWFIAPFLLIRIWKESKLPARERWLEVGRLGSYTAAMFFVMNGAFILWNPVAWIQGVLTPVGGGEEALRPLVQGVLIFFYTGAADVPERLITLLSISSWTGLMLCYWRWFPVMKHTLWFAPVVVLLFNARALQNYYEMFYPLGIAVLLVNLPKEWRDEEGWT